MSPSAQRTVIANGRKIIIIMKLPAGNVGLQASNRIVLSLYPLNSSYWAAEKAELTLPYTYDGCNIKAARKKTLLTCARHSIMAK